MELLFIAAYTVMAVLVGCRITSEFAWFSEKRRIEKVNRVSRYKEEFYYPDPWQWATAFFLALVPAAVWPASLLILLGKTFLLSPPKKVKVEMENQKRRELEKELNLQ